MARLPLLQCYRKQAATYISRVYGVPMEKASELALEMCKETYKPLTAIVVETLVDGKPEVKAVDLATWFDKQQDNLISPSGSVYVQHERKLAKTIAMIIEMKANRKKEKKLQFKAIAAGDAAAAAQHYSKQTLIKITMNSLPGNYGSPYSVFFSKANYNTITSCGRALIGYANSEIEAVLGGNFAWFTMDDMLQHIVAHLNRGIDHDKVKATMEKYKMRWVGSDELYKFYTKMMSQYYRYPNFFQLADLISKLTPEEVQYFYYFQNLRHILMGNEAVFMPKLREVFDITKIDLTQDVSPDELFNLDGALVILCNVAFHKHVDPQDSEIQVYDLPKQRPDLAKKFICIARYVAEKLKDFDDLFTTFIFSEINRTAVRKQKMMIRNSAVISDTDSVIFTVKDWVEWYTKNVYDISEDAYNIACAMIYWITNAVSHALLIYSRAHGARNDKERVMVMKNEFLYPVMVLADVKKHYAGITTVQEGVILPKPQIDIKGVQFKGSTICKPATEFAKNFIETCLWDMYQHGRISAHDWIKKVIDFENRIRADIKAGKTDWYESMALKKKTDYATPMSSNWYYYYAWQEIFAEKYGEILIPIKTPAVPILKPNQQYLDWLSKKSPAISKKFVKFMEESPRGIPTKFVVNPVQGMIPEELIPLVKVTQTIYTNVRPCHLFLKQLGVSCGFESAQLLYSDVYSV